MIFMPGLAGLLSGDRPSNLGSFDLAGLAEDGQ
jgi:hypothetical protein